MVTVPLSVYGAPLITPVDRPRRERRLPLRYREQACPLHMNRPASREGTRNRGDTTSQQQWAS